MGDEIYPNMELGGSFFGQTLIKLILNSFMTGAVII